LAPGMAQHERCQLCLLCCSSTTLTSFKLVRLVTHAASVSIAAVLSTTVDGAYLTGVHGVHNVLGDELSSDCIQIAQERLNMI